LESDYSR
ncbi:hypothetical protein JL09_g5960, partial [Pichia kudriavzevii]